MTTIKDIEEMLLPARPSGCPKVDKWNSKEGGKDNDT